VGWGQGLQCRGEVAEDEDLGVDVGCCVLKRDRLLVVVKRGGSRKRETGSNKNQGRVNGKQDDQAQGQT